MNSIIFARMSGDIFAVDKDAWFDYMQKNLSNNEQEAILYD